MVKSFKKYTNQVIGMLSSDPETKQRIREDILELLQDRYENTGITDPVELLGNPRDFAKTLGEEINETASLYRSKQSKTTLLGLPLLSYSNNPTVTAKGWIAVGTKSMGFISIGAFATGIFSFGGFSIGLFSFGGLSLALLAAFGGVAVAYDTAFGGVAIAYHLAFGGFALAKDIAIGGLTSARLMAYMQAYLPQTESMIKSQWAFKIPDELDSFKVIFNRYFSDFGSLKKSILQSILRIK
ncbi:hypothetical protein SANA_11790 [Gottschalkiaceae bacterium SANA]|nr:hypothetical protein SANA_11790 [Gottschalkiaceae bacterium SANA]